MFFIQPYLRGCIFLGEFLFNGIKYILLICVTTLLIFLGFKAYENSTAFSDLTKYISQKNSTKEAAQKKIDEILEELSLGIYNEHSKNSKNLLLMQREAKRLHEKANIYLYIFFGVYLLFIVMFYFLDKEFVFLLTGFAALTALFSGVFSPLLMMIVYKEIPFIGSVTLSYESKSIVSVIHKLFSDSNYLLGSIVLLFSVIIPIFKSILIIVYGFLKESDMAKNILFSIHKLGKWSMLDVFVVAVLVVLFSTKQDIYTTLSLQVGLYFFTGYVLLSIIGSTLLKNRGL